MRQLAWGDTLCGKEVTPKAWKGGVVRHTGNGAWYRTEQAAEVDDHAHMVWSLWLLPQPWEDQHGMPRTTRETLCFPIFPPHGWAGKTDAELAKEVFERPQYSPIPGLLVTLYKGGAIGVGFSLDCNEIGEPTGIDVNYDMEQVPALILALQNAQVLAARLKEGQP